MKNDSKKYYEIKIIFNKLDSPFYNKAKYVDKDHLKKIKKEKRSFIPKIRIILNKHIRFEIKG